jgi:hypothetical protein
MKAQASYLLAFGGNLDPSHFESNFGPILKGTCAACHNDKIAGEGCQICHTYHTGEFAARMSTPGLMRPIGQNPPLGAIDAGRIASSPTR